MPTTARTSSAVSTSFADWAPAPDRPDPVALLEEQDRRRDPDLVPVRHGRMLASPFAFFRGAARVMAVDLGSLATSGVQVQLCGDAHLSNFGAFGSPERRLVFDLNDFDETLPGPFEVDVARLAASITVAAAANGLRREERRAATGAAAAAYREAMADFAVMPTLDVWYAHLSEDRIRLAATAYLEESGLGEKKVRKLERRLERNVAKARARTGEQAAGKLTEVVDGRRRVVSAPPLLVPARELEATYGLDPAQQDAVIEAQLREYRATLPDDRRQLLERFHVVDWARKVVGVGSVGTRAFVVLLQGRGPRDWLLLQVKEATRSVLEEPGRRSAYTNAGERVVQGQRLMQATSDIFLGWTGGVEADRYFYWRQLRDMKGSADVERMGPEAMTLYARTCGWTLARAHARSGDPAEVRDQLGEGDAFDRAVTVFAERYEAQNARDHAAFAAAVDDGRLEALTGV